VLLPHLSDLEIFVAYWSACQTSLRGTKNLTCLPLILEMVDSDSQRCRVATATASFRVVIS